MRSNWPHFFESILYFYFNRNHEFINIKILVFIYIDRKSSLVLWKQLQQAGFQNEADFTSSKQEIEMPKLKTTTGIVIRSRFWEKIDKTSFR